MNKPGYGFFCSIIALTLSVVGCNSIQNESDGDWITAGFLLESASQNKQYSQSSDEETKIKLISAVSGGFSLTSNVSFPTEFYSRALLNPEDGTVILSVPLGKPLRLIQNVYEGEKSLEELVADVPISHSVGISDAFTVNNTDETVTIHIDMIDSPTVSSTVPADASNDISVDTDVQVSFSNTMDTSTVTTNTSDTTCSGSMQLSSDNFSTCIKMSAAPSESDNDQTFTVTPASSLPRLTTYQIRVLNTVADTTGNHLAGDFTTSTGFTVAPGALTGIWNFVDGDGINGINKAAEQDAFNPELTVFNSELYTAWVESNGSNDQIRVAKWDGTTWNFIDGGGDNGINKDPSKDANFPQLTVFNSELYAAWREHNSSIVSQIRVAKWDGSTWSFVDGGGDQGLNFDPGQYTSNPQLTVFNSELYATWDEYYNSSRYHIRVAKWDGDSTWNFVDGGASTGINNDPGNHAYYPQLTVFNSGLYAIWQEGTVFQIRVVKWDGDSTWNFVDGGGSTGINKDPTRRGYNPQLTVFNSELFAIWYELNSSKRQIRVARWDGNSTWDFVDGNGDNGINKDPGQDAYYPQLIVYNSGLYAIWHETNSSKIQIRAAKWDGDSTWNLVDGDGSYGINKDPGQDASRPQLTVYNSRLFATWQESNGSFTQTRVAVAETE